MRIARRIIPSAIIMMLSSLPASASPSPSIPEIFRELTQPDRAGAAARDLTGGVTQTSPSRALARAFDALGADVAPEPPRAVGIAGLVAAVEAAEHVRGATFAHLPGTAQRAPLSFIRRMGADIARGDTTATGIGGRWEVAPRAQAALATLDVTPLARAAVEIVAAIELLPSSWAPASSAVAATCPGVSGDVIFESGDCDIVIGGTGPNAYGEDADPTLLIDVGGDDVYIGDHAAGIGWVEVVADLDGDDRYVSTAAPTVPGGPLTVSGSGMGSLGLGVLFDALGDDSYEVSVDASAPAPGPVATAVSSIGVGGALGGVGVLIDAGGTDSYDLRADSDGGAADVIGQGAGALGSGILLDLGLEADTMTAAATSTLHTVFTDDKVSRFHIGPGTVTAQGAGVGGAGVLADGGGDDAWTAETNAGAASTIAQGAGILGAGLAVDAGGSDTQVARAIGTVTVALLTHDDSTCWKASAPARTDIVTAIGQGAAVVGAGALIDAGGDDEREVVAANTARARVHVASRHDCSTFGGQEATADADAGPGRVSGQGGTEVGTSALIDLGGNDTNTLRASSTAIADVIMSSPGPDHPTTIVNADDAEALGQGAASNGAALLLDLLGNDSYAVSTSTTTTETAVIDGFGTGASSTTPGVEMIHGWGELVPWFIDLGGDDTYSSSAAATGADDDSCWTNAGRGRGRDASVGTIPTGCP